LETPQNISDILKTLPENPGVYQYFDVDGKILYVGKAKNLKKRVSSYFNKTQDRAKTTMLVKRIHDIKLMVVDSELDALLLENSLIKQYQPKFNIALKDDKTYPWIILQKEDFPRVEVTREVKRNGSNYFGPYANPKVMYTLLDLIKSIYPLRTCNLALTPENIEKKKFKVCLEFHIGNCLGPCEGKQSVEEYDSQIKEIRELLKGNIASVIRDLKDRMKDHAAKFEFEQAQFLKEKIDLLDNYQSKSKVVSSTISNVDVFSMVTDDKFGYVNYLRIIEGAIIFGQTFELKKNLDETDEDLLRFAITELRLRQGAESKEIIVPFPIVDYEDKKLEFTVPQRGEKAQLLELSARNAKYFMLDKHKQDSIKNPERTTERVLEQMKTDLRLSEWPRHIECFDNSNIQGTHPVSACVVFKNAKPSKRDYRHFNVKTVEGPNDFDTMKEVIHRRYKRLLDEGEELPQLIVIDGGKGQLSSALESLEALGLRGRIAMIGIAKRLEEIYYPDDNIPMYLDKRSETLKIIQHMRDEAHRFGITHHRARRSKSAVGTELTNVEGIGEKTAELLLKKFKSVKRLKEAPQEEIVKLIGEAKAKVLGNYFTGKIIE
jgi:excinuclease ABC subunit C